MHAQQNRKNITQQVIKNTKLDPTELKLTLATEKIFLPLILFGVERSQELFPDSHLVPLISLAGVSRLPINKH
jgi:hypothetical protein